MRIGYVTMDARDAETVAAFWCGVLETTIEGRWEGYVIVAPQTAGAPKVAIQTVPEAKATKNHAHLDLLVPDVDAALTEVERLGGSLVSEVKEAGMRWLTCADPAGNEFCLLPEGPPA